MLQFTEIMPRSHYRFFIENRVKKARGWRPIERHSLCAVGMEVIFDRLPSTLEHKNSLSTGFGDGRILIASASSPTRKLLLKQNQRDCLP